MFMIRLSRDLSVESLASIIVCFLLLIFSYLLVKSLVTFKLSFSFFCRHSLLFEDIGGGFNIPMAANAETVRDFDEGLTRG